MAADAYMDACVDFLYQEAFQKDLALYPWAKDVREFPWPHTEHVLSLFTVYEIAEEEPTDARVLKNVLQRMNEVL